MRRFVVILLLVVLVLGLSGCSADLGFDDMDDGKSITSRTVMLRVFSEQEAALNNIIKIDGKAFEGLSAIIDTGITLIPVSAFFKAFGGDVALDDESEKLTVGLHSYSENGDSKYIQATYKIGSNVFDVNGTKMDNLFPQPKLVDGEVYIGFRAVCESFGMEVEWHAKTREISATTFVKSSSKPKLQKMKSATRKVELWLVDDTKNLEYSGKIRVDGQMYKSHSLIKKNDKLCIPVGDVMEAFGCHVYRPTYQDLVSIDYYKITDFDDAKYLVIKAEFGVGRFSTEDKIPKNVKNIPFVSADRVYVDVDTVIETFDLKMGWDKRKNKLTLTDTVREGVSINLEKIE